MKLAGQPLIVSAILAGLCLASAGHGSAHPTGEADASRSVTFPGLAAYQPGMLSFSAKSSF
jgi:hypothetical protein